MFLRTNDGLIAERLVARIGKLEQWPHGHFYVVTYQHGRDVIETRARLEDVHEFLSDLEHS